MIMMWMEAKRPYPLEEWIERHMPDEMLDKDKDKDKDKDDDKAVVAAFEAEVFQFITVALNSSSDAVNRTAAMLNKDDKHTAVLLDVLKEHAKNVTKAKLLLGKSVTIMKRNRSRSRSRAKSSKQ